MRPPVARRPSLPLIGWREWVALPDLHIAILKAKVDTGARTSALHAVDLEQFRRRGQDWLRFRVHTRQRSLKRTVHTGARLLDWRAVTSSTGHREVRPVIRTRLRLGPVEAEIEVTLAARDDMGFRMLLGREALRRRFYVDPAHSYRLGRPEADAP